MGCRRVDWAKMTQGTAQCWEHDNELWLPLRVINFVASWTTVRLYASNLLHDIGFDASVKLPMWPKPRYDSLWKIPNIIQYIFNIGTTLERPGSRSVLFILEKDLPIPTGRRVYRHPSSLYLLSCIEAWSRLPCVKARCTVDPILILKCVFSLSTHQPSFLWWIFCRHVFRQYAASTQFLVYFSCPLYLKLTLWNVY